MKMHHDSLLAEVASTSTSTSKLLPIYLKREADENVQNVKIKETIKETIRKSTSTS